MRRFFGSAIFEGEEVADSAHTQLLHIREVEANRVEHHEREFKMQIDELNFWRKDELARIDSEAERAINEQERNIAYANAEISRINASTAYAISNLSRELILDLKPQSIKNNQNELARISQQRDSDINHQKSVIRSCQFKIRSIQIYQSNRISETHRAYDTEYNIRLTRRDTDIAWSHEEATREIKAILALRYTLPVLMLRCARGPCEYCRAKYGTIGTMAQLEKISCIPPFHDDCRCWLEKVGYVIMSR
ncbi:MAG: hypothetical protein U9N01_04585 [Euryarchaeota archaeon]|nr:hypothetical protein [Euryarchaeota archaeon]